MKAHEKNLNLTSELGKEWTLKIPYFKMKIQEGAWNRLESIIWTGKCYEHRLRDRVYGLEQCVLDTPETSARGRADRDSPIGRGYRPIHRAEGCCVARWSHHRKRVNFESSIFLHENSWKRMKETWISHLTIYLWPIQFSRYFMTVPSWIHTIAELLGIKWLQCGKPILNSFYNVWNRYL